MTVPPAPAQARRDDRLILIVAVIAGIILRLLWLARTPGGITAPIGGGEAGHVAVALATTGQFADAFWAGSGPTAHVMPVMPAIAAAVFRLFAPESAAATLTLLAWSLAQSIAGYLLLRLLFRRLGAPPSALRWGFVMLLLAPAFMAEETIAFRFWEGAAAVCLATAGLIAACAVERHRSLPPGRAALFAALWAATVLVNPIAGFALALAWSWVALRRLPRRGAVRFAALSVVALVAVLGPWTIRNARALGEPVFLRSNFGLEFAIGTDPAALSASPAQQVYAARMEQLHPLYGKGGRAGLQHAGGEVAYSRRLAAETWTWAGAHPAAFAGLTLRHAGAIPVSARVADELQRLGGVATVARRLHHVGQFVRAFDARRRCDPAAAGL